MVTLCVIVGLIVYATFAGCDPLSNPDPSKRIGNPNQLVGYFVLNSFSNFPGMNGLFLASIFCGSLSSVSSYLNSQAFIIWHDILEPHAYFKKFNDNQSLKVNKLLVLLCGVIATGLAFLISLIGGSLVQISTSINGAFNAPILGLFLLGMLFSVSTPRGVIIGTATGFVTALWLSFGAALTKPIYPMLELSIQMCTNTSDFSPLPPKIKSGVLATDLKGFSKIYALSWTWYMTFGVLVTVLVGLLASLIDGGFKKKSKKQREFIYFDFFGFLTKFENETQF